MKKIANVYRVHQWVKIGGTRGHCISLISLFAIHKTKLRRTLLLLTMSLSMCSYFYSLSILYISYNITTKFSSLFFTQFIISIWKQALNKHNKYNNKYNKFCQILLRYSYYDLLYVILLLLLLLIWWFYTTQQHQHRPTSLVISLKFIFYFTYNNKQKWKK